MVLPILYNLRCFLANFFLATHTAAYGVLFHFECVPGCRICLWSVWVCPSNRLCFWGEDNRLEFLQSGMHRVSLEKTIYIQKDMRSDIARTFRADGVYWGHWQNLYLYGLIWEQSRQHFLWFSFLLRHIYSNDGRARRCYNWYVCVDESHIRISLSPQRISVLPTHAISIYIKTLRVKLITNAEVALWNDNIQVYMNPHLHKAESHARRVQRRKSTSHPISHWSWKAIRV